MQVFDESGKGFEIGAELGSGAEGKVFELPGAPGFVVKIYHRKRRPSEQQRRKLKALQGYAEDLKKFAAVPVCLGYSDSGCSTLSAAFMPRVEGHEIHEIYSSQSRTAHFSNVGLNLLINVARNIAASFEELHKRGVVVGDINEKI